MRVRLLKPETFKDEDLAEVSFQARFLFIGLWTLADREGRMEDRPKWIRAELLPYDPSIDIDGLLDELASPKAFLTRYEVEGRKFIQLTNFLKHQKPHPREALSVLPAPLQAKASPRQAKVSQGAASRSVSVSDSDSVIPPPARAEEPDAVNAECEALAAELVKALQRAKEVTGNDGAEVLAHSTVRGKSSPITNPLACSEPARKLWRITTERVYGYIAAFEADQRERAAKRSGPKRGGAPAWDRGDLEAQTIDAQAGEWIAANWGNADPMTRADLSGLIDAMAPPAELRGAIETRLLFGHYPNLSREPANAPEPKAPEMATASSEPRTCAMCGGSLRSKGGLYICADSLAIGCTWMVRTDQPALKSNAA